MMAGSPRQRQFILDLEFGQLLERIIMKRELDVNEIYTTTKLPAATVKTLLRQLVDGKVVRIDIKINVNNPDASTRLVRLL
jgi:hypothetical protein